MLYWSSWLQMHYSPRYLFLRKLWHYVQRHLELGLQNERPRHTAGLFHRHSQLQSSSEIESELLSDATLYIVPGSFECGSVVLAAITIFAPSRAHRKAMLLPIPLLPPVMKIVFPARLLFRKGIISEVKWNTDSDVILYCARNLTWTDRMELPAKILPQLAWPFLRDSHEAKN